MVTVKLVGEHLTVVDVPNVIKIDELVGNMSTSNDEISVAHVVTSAEFEEPWLTIQYDEWLCILEGECIAYVDKDDIDKKVVIKAGKTAHIKRGSTWKPTFPFPSKYIAVCKPAFSPDRLLKDMHGSQNQCIVDPNTTPLNDSDMLYHMTEKKLWTQAKLENKAYFPPTFELDGYYTHATAIPSRLIRTANHFYQDSKDDWICIEFRRSSLLKIGIIVKDEDPLPVGDQNVSEDWTGWICPHVYGGIPPSIVEKEYLMERNGKEFISIQGLS